MVLTGTPIDVIYTDSYDRSSLGGNYTNVVPTATISVVSNKLKMLGGDGSFGNYTKITGTSATNIENYVFTYRFTSDVQGTGIWIGTESISANNAYSFQCFANLSNTGSRGFVSVFINGAFQSPGSSTALTFVDGDQLELSLQRTFIVGTGFQYILTLKNLTTPANTPATLTYSTNPVAGVGFENIGYFTVGTLGGTTNGYYLSITSSAWKNPTFVVLGHSLVQGYNLNMASARFADQIFAGTNFKYNVLGSGGALISDFLNGIREITEMKPTYAIIMLGLNEVILGTASATYKANYVSLRNQLNQAGITCIHCACTPYNGINTANVATYNSDIKALIGGEQWLDTYTPMLGSGTNMNAEYISPDGIHPNAVGHAKISELIKASIGVPASPYDVGTLGYINQFTIAPSSSWVGTIDAMIKGMRSDGDWANIDAMGWFAVENQANAPIYLKSNTTTKHTEIGSPTFTTNRGYTGNGTNSYEKTGFIPSSSKINATQNSWTIGVYCATNLTSANVIDLGAGDVSKAIASYTKWGDGKTYSNMNDFSAASVTTATDAGALTMIQRTASNNINFYRRGVLLGNTTTVSVGIPTVEFYVGANNNNGTAANFSNRLISLWFTGTGTINAANIYSRIQTALTALGANV